MQPSGSGISPKAIAWALLSQVFWVPLVAIDLHDRWIAHQREITPPGRSLPPSPLARATPLSINELLGAARPVQQLAGQANQAVSGALGQAAQGAVSGVGVLLSSAGSHASSLLDRPYSASLDAATPPPATALGGSQAAAGATATSPANTLLGRAFTRAQLLGGSIGLEDLQEGPMAPLALAERAVLRGSGDPLAPLPSPWREPMRQALLKLPAAPLQLSPARLVHVPSQAVTEPVVVPLALQSDGSVDILEAPADPAVLHEIDGWSRQQRLPARGSLVPAVVHLHPLPSAAPVTPSASARPAAARPTATAAAGGGPELPVIPEAARSGRREASGAPSATSRPASAAALQGVSQPPVPKAGRSVEPAALTPPPELPPLPPAASGSVAPAPAVEAAAVVEPMTSTASVLAEAPEAAVPVPMP